ncbi:glycosyltransferase [Paracoccus sp. SCSIO 75233]|uniref:glycosyltransferase n=1 Tax=Paracoccus sp. SCSIO 75233 TaxID=3017782 RepID=UPI0022F074B4|nr:glycosyltransferase [Paracoccus sp. SCSIO 75233]WBU53458.1 glycosyltransferase [Paracoccus sp. SCSIO 75233]
MTQVEIGLALYQGAAHIAAQLDSIAAQDHADWRLIVSDDGSDDDGPRIVREFAAARPEGQVVLVDGPRRGATQNFLSLIAWSSPGSYLSFADQDDVWRPDKISRALTALAAAPEAGIYSACTTICDEALNPLTGSRRFAGPFGFRNSLVQAVTAGNTILLTPEAANLARRAAGAAATAGIESHDWWLYQLVSGAGLGVLRDDAEVLFYRQHAENLKGRNDTVAAKKARISQLFDGAYGAWLAANVAALGAAGDLLTEENRALLSRFTASLSQPGWRMAASMLRMGIRRQTPAGTAALYGAALAGRLRRRR